MFLLKTVSFEKFLILVKSNLLIFVIYYDFCVVSKKSLPNPGSQGFSPMGLLVVLLF